MEKSVLGQIKEQNFEQREKIIRQLGIFELRGLGRELGIPSPTTRKREELISMIMGCLNSGSQSQSTTKSRKGRPCKTLNNLSQIVNAVTGGDESFLSKIRQMKPYEEVIYFAQETPVFSLVDEKKTASFEGVLRISNNNIGYFLDLNKGTKVFIPIDIVGKFDLTGGDLVKASAKKMNSLDQYIATNIERINCKNADEYVAKKAGERHPVISFDKIQYGQFQLFKGRRNIVRYCQNLYEDARLPEFVKNMTEKGYRVIVLSLNTGFEDEILLSNLNGAFKFSTTYGQDFTSAIDRVADAIALAERLIEQGERVIFFVNDIIEVLNILDLCYDSDEPVMGHTSQAVVIAQKLMSLARAYDESDLTLVVTYRDLNEDDQFLINEVLKVGNVFK